MLSSDETIHVVRRAQQGDRAAFASLVEAWTGPVHAIALARSLDPRTAEDVVQNTFLEAWRKLGHLRDPAAFSGWLYRIARSACRAEARRQAARPALQAAPGRPVPAPPSASPEHQARSLAAQRSLLAALETLDPADREVLLLYHLEGRSTAALSQHLDRSEAAVRKRLSRARRSLTAGMLGALGLWLAPLRLGDPFRARLRAALVAAPPPAVPSLAARWLSPAAVSAVSAATLLAVFGLLGGPLWAQAQGEGAGSAQGVPPAAAPAANVATAPLGVPSGTRRPAPSEPAAAAAAAEEVDLEGALREGFASLPEELTWSHLEITCADHGESCEVCVSPDDSAHALDVLLFLSRGLKQQGITPEQYQPVQLLDCEGPVSEPVGIWVSLRDRASDPPPVPALPGSLVEDLGEVEEFIRGWYRSDADATAVAVDCAGDDSACEVWATLPEEASQLEVVFLAMALSDVGYRVRGAPLAGSDGVSPPAGKRRVGSELRIRRQ